MQTKKLGGFDPNDRNRFTTIYHENVSGLVMRDFPTDLEEHSVFNACAVSFAASLSLPTLDDDAIEGLIEPDDSEAYAELSGGPEHQLFGFANNVQGAMELECQLVTNGIYCGDPSGYEDPRRTALEAGKEDWVLLLQLDSDEDKTGMMWGDTGRLYFWIRKDDLVNKDFSKTWCILQCH